MLSKKATNVLTFKKLNDKINVEIEILFIQKT